MDIPYFFNSVSDKLHKVFLHNSILENIVILKAAVVLISISLLVMSLAPLILASSHRRFNDSRNEQIESPSDNSVQNNRS